jgi:hypothetical protein
VAKGKNIFRKQSRGPGGGKRSLLFLLLVVVLIAGILFTLESIRSRNINSLQSLPPQGQLYPMPEPPVTVPVPPVEDKNILHREPSRPLRSSLKKGEALLAVIIDDMGSSIAEAHQLARIGVPLTFSIIPGLGKSRQVAEFAGQSSIEVMIHIPMEPAGYPQQRLEKNGLLLSQSDEEIMKRVNGYFQTVPTAIGANNHMGSRFTEDEAKMIKVLKVLKDKGAFFVDSRTSKASVGYSLAREMGLKTGTRDVFLDNIQDVAYIKGQLAQAAAAARKHGTAIAIGHPRPVTIKALAALLPVMQAEGIRFVPISQLVN